MLLFVHGYNTTFAEAAQRAGQLACDLAFPGPTVLFNWPSDGDLLLYTRDEEKARTAWRQMAQVADQLTRLASGGPGITVLSGLDSIDASAITQEWFGLSHSYFGDNGTVMSDLFQVIHQGLEPGKRAWLKKATGSKGEYWEFKR